MGARKDPPSDCSYVCHKTLNGQFQQPFAFEIFIYPALSLLPKFTKKLIKITTNKFSFPQVQVLNGSQKPSKLGMQWIYRRYYCTWSPEFFSWSKPSARGDKIRGSRQPCTFFFIIWISMKHLSLRLPQFCVNFISGHLN